MGEHDALFKRAFSIPEHAAGELRALLPPSLADKLDLDALTLVPGSFVDADLSDRHADLLFKTTTRHGRAAYVYLLLEHQSEPDPEMPWRMLRYQVQIWERHGRETGTAVPLPPIVPIVIHHGERGWTTATRFHDLIDGLDELVELQELLPSFRLLIDDLVPRSDEELRSRPLRPFAQVTLSILRDARNEERLIASIRGWTGAAMRALRTDELYSLMHYILHVAGHEALEALRAAFARDTPTSETIMTTIAEFLTQQGMARGIEKGIEKGIERGIEKGRLEGKRDMLRRAFVAKFGEAPALVLSTIAAATEIELDTLHERLITAPTLDELLIG